MNYKEIQRQKALSLRDELFRDPGDGVYKKLQREFVLSEPELNLWSGIREDALAYYSDNGITWWDSGDEPTGHLLSSQIACINHLYFIEWKYTESYTPEPKRKGDSGEKRWESYIDLLKHEECPIKPRDFEDLYYEPFYQMMRQTLFGWQMTMRREYGAEDWVHVHVIPNENSQLRETITSPGLSGKDITEAWRAALKQPEKYVAIDPKEFLSPISGSLDAKAIMSYLEKRYWE